MLYDQEVVMLRFHLLQLLYSTVFMTTNCRIVFIKEKKNSPSEDTLPTYLELYVLIIF